MLEDVLARHFAKYPLMEPQDAVKLLYQMEFGPEHLIRDEGKALSMLRQEMDGLSGQDTGGEPLYEAIGGGLCRLNLRPCKARGIGAEDICRLFVETAKRPRGDKKRFRLALEELRQMAEAGDAPFDFAALEIYLARYPDSCPAVHHSEKYRAAYRPAYRIVSQKLAKDYLAEKRGQAAP